MGIRDGIQGNDQRRILAIPVGLVGRQRDYEVDTIFGFVWWYLQRYALMPRVIGDASELRFGCIKDWNAPICSHPDGVSNTVVHFNPDGYVQGRGRYFCFKGFYDRIAASNGI